MHRAIALLVVFACFAGIARAQFSSVTFVETDFIWLLSGTIERGEGAPPIEGGDEIGVFFNDQLIGFTEITTSQAASATYSGLFTFGDNPDTLDVVEGPAVNQVVTFRYYDASTNTTLTDLRALNSASEPVNLVWEGAEVPDLGPEFPLPPEFLAPSRNDLVLRLGAANDNDGGGNGGGGGTTGNPDVNNDGKVDRADAAMVLRIALGGGRLVDEATASRADVNGDGSVTTADAIAVLRAR